MDKIRSCADRPALVMPRRFPIPADYGVLCDPVPDSSVFTCYNQCRNENEALPYYSLCCETCGSSLLGQPSAGIEASESFVVLGALCAVIALGISILRKRCVMSIVWRQRCDMVSLVTLLSAIVRSNPPHERAPRNTHTHKHTHTNTHSRRAPRDS